MIPILEGIKGTKACLLALVMGVLASLMLDPHEGSALELLRSVISDAQSSSITYNRYGE